VDSLNISDPFLLDEDNVKTIHKRVTEGIDSERNIPGRYRSHKVKVGDREHGGIYTPPKYYKDIEMLMSHFYKYINSEPLLSMGPLLRAGAAHYYLGKIHPFGDGNGRTARIIEALILKSAGIKYVPPMVSNYYYRNMDEYYWAFSLTTKNRNHELTPFLLFMLKGLIESLEEIRKKIYGALRYLLFKSYADILRDEKTISERQYDFLRILIESKIEFTIDDLFFKPQFKALYRQVSVRTARRDIKKLLELNLLVADSGKFKVNYYAFEQVLK
jgi:Fic family protein